VHGRQEVLVDYLEVLWNFVKGLVRAAKTRFRVVVSFTPSPSMGHLGYED
jgi:hypothetical protein